MSVPAPNVRCANCVFYPSMPEAEKRTGLCRRYAPRPNPPYYRSSKEHGTVLTLAHWPVVSDEAWCGEFTTNWNPQ